LSPIELLQPNTDYRIDVSLPNGEMVKGVSFTTGDGPFEGTPSPPNASLQHYQFAPGVPLSSCSPSQTGTCVALASDWPKRLQALMVVIVNAGYAGDFVKGEPATPE